MKTMTRLSQLSSSVGISFLSPAVMPGSHCPMRIASVITSDIKDLSTLLVGMPECTIHSRLFNPSPEGENGELRWLYVLDDHEVVFGCKKGLIDAIKEMDNKGAKAIMIIATCIPELIGEDIEGILMEAQTQVNARLTHVMLGQFKNVSYPPGTWKTMSALVPLMEASGACEQIVNVLGRSPQEEDVPMPEIINDLIARGYQMRFLAKGTSLDTFIEAPRARLNIVVSPYTEPLARQMKARFNMPYVSFHTAYHSTDILNAISELSKLLACEEDVFNQTKRKVSSLVDLEKQFSNTLIERSFVMGPRVDLPLALTSYFIQLGLSPLLIHLEEFYPEDPEMKAIIINQGFDPFICRMVNEDVDYEMIKALKPELCFGYFSKGIQPLRAIGNFFDYYGQIGVERSIALLTHVLKHCERGE